MKILAIMTFLALGAGVAHAKLPACPIAAEEADSLAVAAAICDDPGGGGGGGAPVCPVTIPRPADACVCQCKTVNRPTDQRCASGISQPTCDALISTASSHGLLTADAVQYLHQHGFCPIVLPDASQILDFCPVGCFAADTEILTGLTGDGTASYTRAGDISPANPLMALSDDAGVDSVSLVSRQVTRVVYGPEESPLFVFALGTGATLRVTEHHPMVLDNGVIVEAGDVKPGWLFMGIDGQSVAVTSITREAATADVFNFETDGDTQTSHVIGAATVLTGDLKLQNELAAEQSLIELRR